eukprot:9355849-Pyramimonas_sp.AAC.1
MRGLAARVPRAARPRCAGKPAARSPELFFGCRVPRVSGAWGGQTWRCSRTPKMPERSSRPSSGGRS